MREISLRKLVPLSFRAVFLQIFARPHLRKFALRETLLAENGGFCGKPPDPAVSQLDRRRRVLRFTTWLRASVSCGEIQSPPCLPRGGYFVNSTFIAIRDFVTILFQHWVNCFNDCGLPVAKYSLATERNRSPPSILPIRMLSLRAVQIQNSCNNAWPRGIACTHFKSHCLTENPAIHAPASLEPNRCQKC